MGIAAVTFVLCVSLILSTYWMFVVHPEDKAAQALRRRLKGDSGAPVRTKLTKKAPPLSALKVLDAVLVRLGRLVEPLQRTIGLSGLPISMGVILLACGLTAMVTFMVFSLLVAAPSLGALVAVMTASFPYVYVRRAASRRVRKLEEQLPQAIDLIAVSLRAGHTLTAGLWMVSEEIGEPLGSEFKVLYDQQNYGKPLPDVLKAFAERVPLLDARIFVTAVLTQRETGGNLAEILDKLASVIRDRSRIRRQVRAVSAHGRFTGWVLALLPPTLAGLLFVLVPDHMMILIEDPLGLKMVGVASVLQVVGTLLIRRVVNVEF